MTSSDDATSDDGHEGEPAPGTGIVIGRIGRGRRIALIAFAVLVVLAILGTLWANIWTAKLWFDSVGYSGVFRTEYLTKTVMFLAGALVTGAVVWLGMRIAYRSRPIFAPATAELESMDRYRAALEPFRRASFIAVPAIFALFAGTASLGQWKVALLWLNRQPFGVDDPQFHHDIGFYVFTLPWLEFLVGFATMSLVLGILAALVTHYIYGGISITHGVRTTRAARIHLSLLFGAIALVRGIAYWLSRFDLNTADGSLITGMDYTGQHAVLPTRSILAVAAIVCALLFVATIWTNTWRLPIVGVSVLVVCAIVAGGIYPALVSNFKVKPSAQSLQAPYITRNINATLAAYGLNDVAAQTYTPDDSTPTGALAASASTVPGIRLLDPMVVSPTFQALQSGKSYYKFPDSLDVDRYSLDNKTADAVVGVRELNLAGVPAGQRNWVNDHTVYTHGFGFAAAYGNQRDVDGQPVFFEKGIPPTGLLTKQEPFEPRVYFGENTPDYSIVGGPAGSAQRELDYPDSQTGGEKRTTYAGEGGVAMGSPLRRLAYAVKYREYNFLFSDAINSKSRILNNRNPIDRVKKVAPWLTLDGDPYPVVVGGQIQWVVDGYTTSAEYPYSKLQSLGDATADSLTAGSSNVRTIGDAQVNYIRNSVKATVNAYDGSVKLYAWDEQDPVLKAWEGAFGNTVQPMSNISAELMSHLRYPSDLFKVQRELLAKYHMTDPASFFTGGDFWQVPVDPTDPVDPQPPYYLSLAMPGQNDPTFSLTSTYIPIGNRQNLTAFVAVDADAGNKAGEKRSDYGKFRLLEMPRDANTKGPGQFQNDINSSNVKSSSFGDQTLAQFITLNSQSGSRVRHGNLLTLPVAKGLLYVEPIYVQAATGTSFPQLKAVVVGFGSRGFAWGSTLDAALNDLFGGESGASAGDAKVTPTTGATPSPTPSSSPSSSAPSSTPPSTSLAQALRDVQKYYDEGQAALGRKDLAAYATAQAELKKAIDAAIKAQGALSPSPSSTSPRSSPTMPNSTN